MTAPEPWPPPPEAPPAPLPGVAFNEPPAELLPSINASIAGAVAALEPGTQGAIVGLANERGANAAVVAKVGGGWDVVAWVGKRWDADAEYGAAVRRSWR